MKHTDILLGKYLVTPLPRLLMDGGFSSSVSIRSGSGRATTDRVFRLDRRFANEVDAAEHALVGAKKWIDAKSPHDCVRPMKFEWLGGVETGVPERP